MDGDARNDEQILIGVHETGFHPIPVFHNDAARDGQRAVEPGAHDHAAVALRLQLHAARLLDSGVLHAPRWDVAVAQGNAQSGGGLLRDAEREDGGAVSRRIVFPAGAERPRLRLGKTLVACLAEAAARLGGGVPRTDAGLQKVQYGLDFIHVVSSLSGRTFPARSSLLYTPGPSAASLICRKRAKHGEARLCGDTKSHIMRI